jgi:putative membrane protein
MAEVWMGTLAEQKAASPIVRNFGQLMATDHAQAGDQLGQILAQKGAAMPSRPSLGERSRYGRIEELSPHTFDQVYARDMVTDHEKDIKDLEQETHEITDPDLKAWAAKTLQMMQHHLGLARQMETEASQG